MNENASRLQVNLEGFSGPLDLLVHLIAKHEMDIFSVNISAITDSYLQAVRAAEEKDLDQAGEYLVLAATLVRYKSRALLPKDESEPEDEELQDQILELRRKEYEQFRQLADELRAREGLSAVLFPRLGAPPEGPHDVVEYSEVSIYDLHRAFVRILEEIGTGELRVVEGESYSVDEKMMEIEALIALNERVLLSPYLRSLQSKMEIIVVFLALLELIRQKEIRAQALENGEIVLEKRQPPVYSGEES